MCIAFIWGVRVPWQKKAGRANCKAYKFVEIRGAGGTFNCFGDDVDGHVSANPLLIGDSLPHVTVWADLLSNLFGLLIGGWLIEKVAKELDCKALAVEARRVVEVEFKGLAVHARWFECRIILGEHVKKHFLSPLTIGAESGAFQDQSSTGKPSMLILMHLKTLVLGHVWAADELESKVHTANWEKWWPPDALLYCIFSQLYIYWLEEKMVKNEFWLRQNLAA